MEKYKISRGSSLLLDLIRGLSAQLVVIGHGISFFGILTFLHPPNFPWIQNIAVLVFFIISGYLIPYSTIRKMDNDKYSFTQYFIDRFSRIYTVFVPCLIFVGLLDLISKNLNPSLYGYNVAFNIKTLIGNLIMFQDHPVLSLFGNAAITSFGSARPFWTLAIEWWIYLCFGYLILVIFRKKRLSIVNYITLAFFSIVPMYNLIMGRGNGLTVFWLFGGMIYIILNSNILNNLSQNVRIIFMVTIGVLGFVRAYLVMNAYDPIFAFLLAFVLCFLIEIFKEIDVSKFFSKFIVFNASYSYTLYLIHYSVLDFTKNFFRGNNTNPYVLFFIGFIVSNIIAIVLGRYIELHLTKKIKVLLHNKWKAN